MAILKQWHRIAAWEYAGLCLIALITLVLHFSIITQPPVPVFDEDFYVTDARYILQGLGSERIEHPPLGKLFMVMGMFLFGDNPFGWRFFSVIAGILCIILFYLICRRLTLSRITSFIATSLLAFENLSFVQAGVAMLDVYSLAFMLASFWFYLKGQYWASGLSIGLSTLAKLSGALGLVVIVLHWLITSRKNIGQFVASMVLAPVSFLVLMPLFDFAVWRKLVNPIAEIKTMFSVTLSSTFTPDAVQKFSRPWDWVIRPESIIYWSDPHYLGMLSPSLWALIIPVVGYLIYRSLRGSKPGLFGLSWFIGTYLIWIPISLVTDRQSYIYYFYPTVGAICIGLAAGLTELSNSRGGKSGKIMSRILPAYLLIHLGTFVFMSPASPYWAVPACVIFYACSRYLLDAGRQPGGPVKSGVGQGG